MTQAWQAEALGQAHNERTWSAPAQSNTRQWHMVGDAAQHDGGVAAPGGMAWPALQEGADRQQSNAVPSAVQQRAAQYAGDEGLARPPTRPPSDWRSRQHQPYADDTPTTGEPPSQSFERLHWHPCQPLCMVHR
jgi:hypothetical protein